VEEPTVGLQEDRAPVLTSLRAGGMECSGRSQAAVEVAAVIDLGGGRALCVQVKVGGRSAGPNARDRVKSRYFRRLGVGRRKIF
jgi:hypothetical protein